MEQKEKKVTSKTQAKPLTIKDARTDTMCKELLARFYWWRDNGQPMRT